MSVITCIPEPNIWNQILTEFAAQRPPFVEEDAASITTELQEYDPSKVTPVLFGQMHSAIGDVDLNAVEGFDASVSHTAFVGYAFVDKPPLSPEPGPSPPPKDSCPPAQYLEYYIFPVLLPALEKMLHQAKEEKCFERKRTKFNALDFLTEYLYKKNPNYSDREDTTLWDIPFVQEWLKEHPRPPLPKSLLWSEAEASLIIQSFWKGYKVRRQSNVQELRQWQREWRLENENISSKVSEFWAKKMPGEESAAADMSSNQTKDNLDENIVHIPTQFDIPAGSTPTDSDVPVEPTPTESDVPAPSDLN